MPFMSMCVLLAMQEKEKHIHTPLDDLESFLWLLIWGVVYASKDIDGSNINRGINLMLKAWSGDVGLNRNKWLDLEDSWRDAVFGDLIAEWSVIFRKARKVNIDFALDMKSMEPNSQERDIKCDELESYCKGIYREVLESGFKHLDDVKECIDWNRAVAANNRKFLKKQFKAGTGGAEGK